ncbi:photosynthetic reaction center subunit H [Polynucleobacter paneuropaeus]|jgi:photosynthetic reaction center H subunit|nr:photosynthetic reaction center subunit H [Polynucleobacter paneuropaeus]MBT8617181.1 photosynthetic reaction center subunit H [Polynucleobacter paneuropaeus]MBT8619061.1 photosynthetic reaction center subunit H [Polynucleobacter paneuropaeus]MBT8619972.1 photosynthetic reaction center subunit H [Polynucleobacter paneuropaeus]MBT8626478.1 photosynthetic reaction center subunit H [Polynucleobacter paneuropaeus]
MGAGAITQYVDLAQVVVYLFLFFFVGLVIYLTLESKREGFPLETERFGQIRREDGILGMPRIKKFVTEFGETYFAPSKNPLDTQKVSAEPIHPWNGAPLTPVGNPLLAGVGPGSYANRADHVDYDLEGHARIRPLRKLHEISISTIDTNPIGLAVIAADGEKAGTVTDVWVDHMEMLIRYLEVDVGGTKTLLPINFSKIGKRDIKVQSILADQFKHVPKTKHPEEVTLLEEEKIMAYFGAGTLYATPSRQEPLL